MALSQKQFHQTQLYPSKNIQFTKRQQTKIRSRSALKVQAQHDYKPNVAFVFPGQGSQSIGMAKDLCAQFPKAKSMFEEASDILGYNLLQVCSEGPGDKLYSTAVSQPAIFVASLAGAKKLQEEQPDVVSSCNVTAGLSIGEYTALCFADVFSFSDGVKLVKQRGEAMQQTAITEKEASGMLSVLGVDIATVLELCDKAKEQAGDPYAILEVGNYLCPGNYVVSGGLPQLKAVEKLSDDYHNIHKTAPLRVDGAYHTQFMDPAVDSLKQALSGVQFKNPRIPVISNVDAQPHEDPEKIKETLALQVIRPVQWEQTIRTLLDKGLKKSYEIGPNKILSGIFHRMDENHECINVSV